jgi:hypothetical protein
VSFEALLLACRASQRNSPPRMKRWRAAPEPEDCATGIQLRFDDALETCSNRHLESVETFYRDEHAVAARLRVAQVAEVVAVSPAAHVVLFSKRSSMEVLVPWLEACADVPHKKPAIRNEMRRFFNGIWHLKASCRFYPVSGKRLPVWLQKNLPV